VAADSDRLKRALASVVRGAIPNLDYLATYRGTVLKQHGSGSVDVSPEDSRLPDMSDIPLRVGVPGVDVRLKVRDATGAPIGPPILCLIGWENGQPDKPFATLWPTGISREQIEKVTFSSLTIELGSAGLTPLLDGVVRAETPCQFTGLPHAAGGKTSLCVLAKEK
jgi:hypothetical protein